MNYPVWELALGGGMLIAIVAILHLFVAHFAIGGGLWLVVTEMRARRRQDEQLLAYVKSHTRFFMLLTLVFGAISGVGIWFTIGLVSPTTVSALIHAYVWGWAMEWVCFFVEIAAALVYYYGWDKLSPKTHVTVGWIYFVAAWMSLAIINGIITFMLTPGNWLETHSFWVGFFNPTYWPSLFVRTFAGWGTAGILTLLTAAFLPRGEFRNRVIRYSASWVVVAAILGGLAGLWYKSAIPGWSDLVLGSVPILPVMLTWLKIGLVSSLILALWPLLAPKTWHPVGVVLIVFSGLLVFASGEWVRETGRKPFTIHGYLYSTGMLVSQEETLATDGVLAHTRWIDPAARTDEAALGQQIYRAYCQPCHTMDGYNGLRPFLAHWSEETIASLLPRLQYIRALMPPWYGNEYENECLTQYLLSESATGVATFPPHAEAAQQLAWDTSCGLCHTLDRFRPLRDSLAGYSREDLEDLLDSVGELTDEMPAYYGNDQQRELLLEYLEQAAGSEPTGVAVAEGSTP
jgi:mono/diheme cytochrome c family protein